MDGGALPCAFRPAWTFSTRLSTPVARLVGLNGRAMSSRRSCHSKAGRGKGPRLCPAAAVLDAPSAAGQFAATSAAAAFPVPEETVDGLAVTVEDGSIDASQFQAHDQAVQLVAGLTELSSLLSGVLDEGKEALNKWQGLTLPSDTQEEFKQVYRSGRKEVEKQRKEERKLRRLQREQAAAPAGDAVEALQQPLAVDQSQAWYAPQQQPQQPQQPQQQSDLAERRARRAQQRQARDAAATVAPAASLAAQQPAAVQPVPQQPVKQRLQQQQQTAAAQQQQRQRRRRSSTLAGSAAAAAAAPVAAAAAPAATAPAAAAAVTAVPAGLHASSSSSSSRQDAEPPTANRGGPAGPRPAATDMQLEQQQELLQQQQQQHLPVVAAASTTSTAAVAVSSGSSLVLSSSSSSSRASPGLGFVPLTLGQPAVATPARGAVPRRNARAAGVRSPRTKAAAIAAAPAPVFGNGAVAPTSSYGKFGDNNINGLDMRVELLSADQEKELAMMVQDLLRLEEVAKQLTQELGRLPSDVEWMEAAGCINEEIEAASLQGAIHAFQNRLTQGRMAKQVMISANYKLVVSICRKYQGYGMAIGDLINEGIAGLVKGVERFEPSKGCKFSTYAHWWIRQSITRSLSEQGRLVRLPSHLQEMLTKMTKISRTYEAQYGKEPTLEDLAKELGVDPSKISDAYEAVFTPRSLDQPMNDGEGATLGDVVEDERMMGADEAAYMESLKHDLEGVLGNLPAREAGVLRMRFGLLDGTEHTLDEIGAQFNVTRERIRQIEAKAIRHLRARQLQPGSVMADYQEGGMESKQLASRTSSGTKKQG